MQGRRNSSTRTAITVALVIALHSAGAIAGNSLVLRKGLNTSIEIDLSNMDGIAGAQFSVRAHGGLRLQSFEPTVRLTESGVAVYQSFKDDSTLNIVLLAPVRSFLPAGEGPIGKIFYGSGPVTTADSLRVLLSNVVICDVAARSLDIVTTNLAWSLDGISTSSQSIVALEQNYPNPFNPSTTISYRLEKTAHVKMAVYDITGRMVNILVDEDQQPGRYAVKWTADGNKSAHLASGMYVARLNVGSEVAAMKMILAK